MLNIKDPPQTDTVTEDLWFMYGFIEQNKKPLSKDKGFF